MTAIHNCRVYLAGILFAFLIALTLQGVGQKSTVQNNSYDLSVIDSIFATGGLSLSLAQELRNKTGVHDSAWNKINFLYYKAMAFDATHCTDSALYYYKLAIKAQQNAGTKDFELPIYLDYLQALVKGSDYLTANELSQNMLEQYFADSISLSQDTLALLFTHTGMAFYYLDNYQRANYYLLEALKIYDSSTDLQGKALATMSNRQELAENENFKQSLLLHAILFILFIIVIFSIVIWYFYKDKKQIIRKLEQQNKEVAATEQKLSTANIKLQSSVERLKMVIKNIPVMLFAIDKEQQVIFWNAESERVTGYNANEILNNRAALKLLFPQGAPGLESEKQGVPLIRHQTSLNCKDGQTKIIEWSLVKDYVPIVGWKEWAIGIDITERVEFENSLEQEKALLNSIINSIPYLIFYKDINGRYLGHNPAFSEFYKKQDSFLGKTDFEMFEEEQALEWQKTERRIIEEKSFWSSENWVDYDDGRRILLHTLKIPFYNSDGEVLGIMGISRDITDRYEFEKALHHEKEKAEQSDKLKSAFLANMSHEIRTPMNAIIGFTDLMSMPNLEQEQRDIYIQYINNSGNNLLNLIDDIIDTAKIEAGQIKIRKSRTYINRILEELLVSHMEIKNKMDKSDVEIRLVKGVDDKNLSIHSDPHRIRQIISNLVGNAMKFVDVGYIEFGYHIIEEETLKFYVKDTGIGIPEEKHELIFERFGQVENTYNRNHKGTGLGLAITKKLVELLGGKIWVQSKVNVGTTFYFTLPYQPVKRLSRRNKDEEEIPKVSSDISTINWTGKNILVAEDDRMNYLLMEKTLSKTNANIVWAKDGKEALDYTIPHSAKYKEWDLILMDIQMPFVNGYDVTREIRKFNKNVPILAQTAFAIIGEEEKSTAAGCTDFLTKPVKPLLLLQRMQFYLNRARTN